MNEMILDLQALIERDPSRKFNTDRKSIAYGWHDALLPPECRRLSLKGKRIQADMYIDIYYMMASWYERISGQKAPCDFQVYKKWKNHVRSQSLSPEAVAPGKAELIIEAIAIGTQHKREKRDPYKALSVLKEL